MTKKRTRRAKITRRVRPISKPRKPAPKPRRSVPLALYEELIDKVGERQASRLVKALSKMRARPERQKIAGEGSSPLVDFLPPKGRGKLWRRVFRPADISQPIKITRVTNRERRREMIRLVENRWITRVAGARDTTKTEVRKVRAQLHAAALANWRSHSPAWRKKHPLKRMYMLADLSLRAATGAEGS